MPWKVEHSNYLMVFASWYCQNLVLHLKGSLNWFTMLCCIALRPCIDWLCNTKQCKFMLDLLDLLDRYITSCNASKKITFSCNVTWHDAICHKPTQHFWARSSPCWITLYSIISVFILWSVHVIGLCFCLHPWCTSWDYPVCICVAGLCIWLFWCMCILCVY